jgi:FkbM family methyltransferase
MFTGIRRGDVERAYREVLGRDPESPQTIALHRNRHRDVWSLVRDLLQSDEFRRRSLNVDAKPFNAAFDVGGTITAYGGQRPPPRPGYVTNFLGAVTDVRFVADLARRSGEVEGLPFPGNFHADTAEWAACLRAAELADGSFTAVELGAGWGPWLVNACLAARRARGATRFLCVGVEADKDHFDSMQRHLVDNGFGASEVRLHHAAVGPSDGFAAIPVPSDSSADWGLRAEFFDDRQTADSFAAAGTREDYRGFKFRAYSIVKTLSLPTILDGIASVNLLHVDVQGSECDVLLPHLRLLSSRVKYLVVGTHSRVIEGRLIDALGREGWSLEIEMPCSFAIGKSSLDVTVDGVQGWRGPMV